MRLLTGLLLTVPLLGCGDSTLTIRGTLRAGSEATDVYVVGQPIRSRIEADSFVITGVTGDTVDLEFAEREDRLGRMRLERGTGPEIALRGIWIEDGTAFATTLAGAGSATVNGIRMAAVGDLPPRVTAHGVVLAASGRGDAFVLRPADEGLPDLRVVLTPGTAVEEEYGRPGEADLEFGDSLRLEGTAESGYVVATRIVLGRRSAAAADDMGGPEEEIEPRIVPSDASSTEPDVEVEERREGPRSLVRPGGGRGRGRGLQRRD